MLTGQWESFPQTRANVALCLESFQRVSPVNNMAPKVTASSSKHIRINLKRTPFLPFLPFPPPPKCSQPLEIPPPPSTQLLNPESMQAHMNTEDLLEPPSEVSDKGPTFLDWIGLAFQKWVETSRDHDIKCRVIHVTIVHIYSYLIISWVRVVRRINIDHIHFVMYMYIYLSKVFFSFHLHIPKEGPRLLTNIDPPPHAYQYITKRIFFLYRYRSSKSAREFRTGYRLQSHPLSNQFEPPKTASRGSSGSGLAGSDPVCRIMARCGSRSLIGIPQN